MRAAVIISAASAFIGVAMADDNYLATNRCDLTKTSFDASKIYLDCWRSGGGPGVRDTVQSGVDLSTCLDNKNATLLWKTDGKALSTCTILGIDHSNLNVSMICAKNQQPISKAFVEVWMKLDGEDHGNGLYVNDAGIAYCSVMSASPGARGITYV